MAFLCFGAFGAQQPGFESWPGHLNSAQSCSFEEYRFYECKIRGWRFLSSTCARVPPGIFQQVRSTTCDFSADTPHLLKKSEKFKFYIASKHIYFTLIYLHVEFFKNDALKNFYIFFEKRKK